MTGRLVVLGHGPAAATVLDLVDRVGRVGSRHDVVAVLADEVGRDGDGLGPPVDGPLAAIVDVDADGFVVAYTDPAARRAAVAAMPPGLGAVTLVDPDAILRQPFSLGAGTVVLAQASVCAHLGRHVLVGAGATVAHHSRVGDCSVLHSAATVNGAVRLGEGCSIGRRASVLETRRVGAGATVRARSVVAADVGPGALVAGVPARPVGTPR